MLNEGSFSSLNRASVDETLTLGHINICSYFGPIVVGAVARKGWSAEKCEVTYYGSQEFLKNMNIYILHYIFKCI